MSDDGVGISASSVGVRVGSSSNGDGHVRCRLRTAEAGVCDSVVDTGMTMDVICVFVCLCEYVMVRNGWCGMVASRDFRWMFLFSLQAYE